MERLIAYALNMTVEQLIGALIILAIAYMFKRQNDLYYKYNALNTIVFALDKHTKLNGVRTGNSQGDFILDWDGVPEKKLRVRLKPLNIPKHPDRYGSAPDKPTPPPPIPKKNKGTSALDDL